ncbi:MAG: adenylate/guanylate cyclase domain-containing protein [Desulfosalsimonas sp.]|uniref:adenylate/guanylate cyclase domain-containing protein n=1 Tax=Desulfosalsimonas sp. TaxID=3073848 RepID=UPI00397071E3
MNQETPNHIQQPDNLKQYIKKGEFPRWRIFFNLYLRNVIASLLGFAIILLLNFFTPMTSSWLHRALVASGNGIQCLLGLFPLILVIIAIFQYRFQRPVFNFLTMHIQGENPTSFDEEDIRRRLLNLPMLLAVTNLMVYILVPGALLLSSWLLDLFAMDFRMAVLSFFWALMIGLITACLSFFIVENYTRHICIPMVFPEGGLTRVQGAIRINVMRRIRLLNLAGTLTPMMILVVTLGLVVLDVLKSPGFSNQLAIDIFIFSLILCSVFIYIGFRLNRLVGRSVMGPLKEMLQAIQKVEQGDFSHRIQVVSNDELGELAEAGNKMIQGLAEREQVRESFGRYVTPEIRDKILSGEIPLDGEQKIATMLFADLRDFTSYVETNPPEEVILSMRSYFTYMEEAIREEGGLVLQFVGDELEAVFGVPIEVKQHADRALHAALKMRRRLEELNEKRENAGKPSFQHGVGICSGPVLAGNTGSRDHPSYALIGDTVNKAARVQELTKEFGCEILIARETRDMLSMRFSVEPKEARVFKGFSTPIETFEVLEHFEN